MKRVILVTGATGKQGGAVVKALLASGVDFQILALSRDPDSPAAQKLAAKSPNLVVVQGDLDDTEAIFEKAKHATPDKIWGVFSIQSPGYSKDGPDNERRQGKALAETAIKHGVQYFVYSSVDRHGEASINNPTDIPHFASKHDIEHYLVSKAAGTSMRWTILRPAAFMENHSGGFATKVMNTAWKMLVRSRPLQLVAVDDIGVFAAKAFIEPDRYSGEYLSLAGDELTYDQMVLLFRQKTGTDPPQTWGIVVRLILWMSSDLTKMYAFFENEGYAADIAKLRKLHPGLKDFAAWLEDGRKAE